MFHVEHFPSGGEMDPLHRGVEIPAPRRAEPTFHVKPAARLTVATPVAKVDNPVDNRPS